MIVILLGPPGSGKGTQALRLATERQLWYLASGDLFRRAIASGSEVGQRVRHYVERGLLVPDSMVVDVVMSQLDEPEARAGVVLDGFPRSRPQAEALDAALKGRDERLNHVLYLNVPLNVVEARLTGRRLCRDCTAVYHIIGHPPREAGICDVCGGELYQRVDDQPETIARRLEVYTQTTVPLIAYYQQRGVLREIDGNQPIEGVTAWLLSAIEVDPALGRSNA
ncbi:MAG: adenylate kinase [Dehalococcoidia bacterium]|nr:adenylate kinase [Dehalococcoidia bacterium]